MPQRVAYVLVRFPRPLAGWEISKLVSHMEEPSRAMRFKSLPDDCGFGDLIGLSSERLGRNLCVAPDPRFGSFSAEHLYDAAAIGSYDWKLTRQITPILSAGKPDPHLEELLIFGERLEAELQTDDTVVLEPQKWLDLLHPRLEIVDGDGWKGAEFDEPITKPEFKRRLIRCTIGERPQEPARELVS